MQAKVEDFSLSTKFTSCMQEFRGRVMEARQQMTIAEKLKILADAAKYDVACTSSGSDRAGVQGAMGSAVAAGICHAFSSDGRCISLLKILLTNECIYDCRYCVNRRSNDTPRAAFTPEEICTLTMEFYRRNYIEGLFLSSGVLRSPDHTMELMYEVLFQLRKKHRFMGYIHVKGIPGTDPVLLEKIGFLADRMSVNLELPTREGLELLAPAKKEENILGPMRHIQSGIHGNAHSGKSAYQTTRLKTGQTEDVNILWENAVPKEELQENAISVWRQDLQGKRNLGRRLDSEKKQNLGQNQDFWKKQDPDRIAADVSSDRSLNANKAREDDTNAAIGKTMWLPGRMHEEDRNWMANGKLSDFVPAGQSTQMIIGASKETDYQIIQKAEMLYQSYDLKRVFYSAFINTTHDSLLPETPEGPPLLREHRLYQADFLMRYYGFYAGEILSPAYPDLDPLMDPKCTWALRHMECFPVEVMKADYGTLLRVPGIGPKAAERIVKARRTDKLSFDALKRMGVVLKRAHYFILCCGKQMFRLRMEAQFISHELLAMDREKNWKAMHASQYTQMNLFTDFELKVGKYA